MIRSILFLLAAAFVALINIPSCLIWHFRSRTDKAGAYLRGTLKYNVTPEFIVSERYSSVDPWFTPWQPNGSGAGRLNGFLLDYYGERVIG